MIFILKCARLGIYFARSTPLCSLACHSITKHPPTAGKWLKALQAMICKMSINAALQSLEFSCTLWHKRWHFCQFVYAYARPPNHWQCHSFTVCIQFSIGKFRIDSIFLLLAPPQEICHSKLGSICLFWQSEKFIAYSDSYCSNSSGAHKFHDEWKLKTKQFKSNQISVAIHIIFQIWLLLLLPRLQNKMNGKGMAILSILIYRHNITAALFSWQMTLNPLPFACSFVCFLLSFAFV